MPQHVATADDSEVTKIPMDLASEKYGCRFWRVLLHAILPGILLSARPALLAALSLRLGVGPLLQAAEEEMLRYRHKWNDINVPENWNVNCLSLLLDADQAYRRRRNQGLMKTMIDDSNGDGGGGSVHQEPHGLLEQRDRSFIEHLVSF